MDAVFGAMLKPQAPAAQGPVAQAQLDIDTFMGKVMDFQLDMEWGTEVGDMTLASINGSINDYNNAYDANDNSQGSLNLMMALLDIVEHKVYRWFDATKTPEMQRRQMPMFYLLDEVQGEHKTLIERIVNNDLELWVHDEPMDERGNINELWNAITSGENFLRIQNTVQNLAGQQKQIPEEFMRQLKVEIFSSYARIMSRPQGRKLLNIFLENNNEKLLEFELSSLEDMLINKQLGPEKTTSEYAQKPILVGKPEGDLRKGEGSGSKVRYAPNTKDSRIMDSDEEGNRIIAPTFLGYSHETTHSAHYWEGTYFPGAKMTNLPPVYGTDMEELLTILPQDRLGYYDDESVSGSVMKDTEDPERKYDYQSVKNVPFSVIRQINQHIPTEGDIRSEHGLSIRHGHKNNTTTNNTVLPHDEEKITDSSEWVQPLLNAITDQVNNVVNANQDTGNGNCFITTACVQAAHLPDDCEELTVLRHFRDTYVRRLEDGELLVKLYYKHAPVIVREIAARENASLIWQELMKVIHQCVEDIRAEKLEKAAATYINMMMVLRKCCC
jgi:hypothetical protein